MRECPTESFKKLPGEKGNKLKKWLAGKKSQAAVLRSQSGKGALLLLYLGRTRVLWFVLLDTEVCVGESEAT